MNEDSLSILYDKIDFNKYPRDINSDIEVLKKINCDILFLPIDDEIYPKNDTKEDYSFMHAIDILEGEKRPGHFFGVLTVVHKLFNLVQPNRAYFGEKDFEQYELIKSLAQAFLLDCDIKMISTVREDSGLAYSSRNKRLTLEEKKLAANIYYWLKNEPNKDKVILSLEKKGFETRYITEANPSFTFNNHPIPPAFDLTPLGMYPEGSIPEGMVPVDAGNFIPALIGEGVQEYNLSTFYIDKNEVTNKEYKEFVDAKGYEIFQYWTDMDFIYNGESLSWEEAKELMVDSTGMNGPANWEIGSYKDGEENLPVTGISWYEAQAYAKYKGNILPPMYHWAKAAFPITEIAAPISPVLLKKSNFSNKSVSAVGTNGFGPYGTYDMAGNVSEWSWNIFGGRGLTLGGNFSDPAYSASSATPSPRFVRSANIGFRTVRLLNPRDLNPFGDPIERQAPKPAEFYKPFTDEEFKLYSRNFEVGSIDLNPKVIYVDETHPVWVKERIQLNVGYNNEKMDVLIFKPKNVVGSIDSVILYPGANYYRTPPTIDEVDPGEYGLDFVIKSGRALIWPAYKGSMNRITNMNISFPSTQEHMRLFRQLLSHWTVDTSRTIDFLETRKQEFNENIFYVGMSYGGLFTPHVLLFEDRFKAAVFYVGGAWPGIPPMADGKNHIPRIKLPILMLNGEQDYLVPSSAPKAMYAALGTPKEDKKLIFYESGHWPLPRNQMIKETLKWFEDYRD